MHEVDFLAVGESKSGDAIALRFQHPDAGVWVHVIIDAGFQDTGDELVAHVKEYYDTDVIDLAIVSHPDGDHIGGMGKVVRQLSVKQLWLHNIGAHSGAQLPAAKAVNDLMKVAADNGTDVFEAWEGAQAFGGALTVLGPSKSYYEQLVKEQVEEPGKVAAAAKAIVQAARGVFDRIATSLGIEIPFSEGEVNPRNNSSMTTMLKTDGKTLLFTADSGVPALERAWDYAERVGLAERPDFVQIPHHGSRRNASSAWLTRLLGDPGQDDCRVAFVSCIASSDKHPSGKVVNAHKRRGCEVIATAGFAKCHRHDTPSRWGWTPAIPLDAMLEEDED